jgi:hypothetical protein
MAMKVSIAMVAMAATLISFLAQSQAPTDGPNGLGFARNWVVPCELLDRQLKGETLTKPVEARLGTLCEGALLGVMSVNWFKPPFLPFCVRDNDRVIDYAETFLAFMKANPDFEKKAFGIALLVALGRAHPKSECGG